jgi:hypothetical protein
MKRKNPVNEIVVLSNPRRRKSHVRRRRNPSGGSLVNSAIGVIKSGAVGAVGGLANDAAYGFAKKFLPEALHSGFGRTATKLGFATLLGIVARKVAPNYARDIATGAATVVLHELGKELLNANAPGIPLGDFEDNELLGYSGAQTVGAYMPAAQKAQTVGEYMQP